MKIKSSIITQASGSIGGLTASHNRGGLYLRARATPVNPNSPNQQAVRGYFAQLATLWVALTGTQRAGWDTYAANVLLPDTLGEARNIGGLAMYIRSNVPRLQGGQPRVDDAPTIYTLAEYTTPLFDAPSEALQDITLNFDVLDDWVNEDDAAMYVYTARPQNQSINYFKGPYRISSAILGNALLPPVSPNVGVPAFPYVAGNAVFARINVTRADGRLGVEQFIRLIAGP